MANELAKLNEDQLLDYYHSIKSLNNRDLAIYEHDFDAKFAYHCVRLLDECEQILVDHDVDLQRNREQLKAIRRGEWDLEQLTEWFTSKEKHLEALYQKSTLPERPDWKFLNQLLLNILEHHYGSISQAVSSDKSNTLIAEIESVLSRYR